jgi:predicted Zn-dependent protease
MPRYKTIKATLLATAALCATVPFNMGGCADTTAAIGGMVGGQQGSVLGRSAGTLGETSQLKEKDELAMGETVAATVTSQYPIVKDSKLNQYVAMVGLTLANSTKRPDGNWLFAVVESDQVNAFSGPDGFILVTRGAIAQMRDEAELAGVLAHEITHVLDSHGLEAAKKAGYTSALANLANLNERSSAFSDLAGGVADTVLKKGYDRKQEDEADEGAVKLVYATGYDPNSYLHFIQRIAQQQHGGGGGVMSTHPGAAERATKIAAEIQQLNVTKQGAVLADRFQRMTKTP